jgi:rhamnosyl/mannosyltransferase
MASVLHAFKVYKPDIEGGIPNVIESIATGVTDGFTHEILVARDRGLGQRDVVGGVTVRRLASAGTLWSLPIAPAYPLALAQAISDANILAVHAPFPLADLSMALVPRSRRRRLVVHWHADIVRQKALEPIYKPLLRRTLAAADAIIVSHDSVAQSSGHLGGFAHKVVAVPFGLDPQPWIGLTAADRLAVAALQADPRPLFVSIGRLVGYKGFDVLVEAARRVDARFVICGAGVEEERLRAQIERHGLADRVTLRGFASQAGLRQLLHAARALVMPSVSIAETFGLVQVEAMFCGAAVVNTSLPTAVGWVARDGQEALTVPPRDPAALTAALSRLAGEPALAARLGEAGRARALALFSASAFHAGVAAVYRAVLEGRPVREVAGPPCAAASDAAATEPS